MKRRRIRALNRKINKKFVNGSNCWIASVGGKTITLNKLVEVLNRILNSKIKPKYTQPRSGDVMHSIADISFVQRVLGFKPKYNFKYGLKKQSSGLKRNMIEE